MASPRPGQLERALASITIGVEESRAERDRQVAHSGGHEMEQQIRVPIAGKAGNGWGFAEVQVSFLYPFLWMPLQRGAPFDTPHFSYGIDHKGNPGLVVNAAVLQWGTDDSNHVVGATIQIGVSAPMLAEAEEQSFSAVAHLTFQGYGAETMEGEAI